MDGFDPSAPMPGCTLIDIPVGAPPFSTAPHLGPHALPTSGSLAGPPGDARAWRRRRLTPADRSAARSRLRSSGDVGTRDGDLNGDHFALGR